LKSIWDSSRGKQGLFHSPKKCKGPVRCNPRNPKRWFPSLASNRMSEKDNNSSSLQATWAWFKSSKSWWSKKPSSPNCFNLGRHIFRICIQSDDFISWAYMCSPPGFYTNWSCVWILEQCACILAKWLNSNFEGWDKIWASLWCKLTLQNTHNTHLCTVVLAIWCVVKRSANKAWYIQELWVELLPFHIPQNHPDEQTS